MRSSVNLFGVVLAIATLALWTGCRPSSDPTSPPPASMDPDHDGHDHDGHDHDGHDHAHGDHHDHDHGAAKSIDAEATGLSSDDLVSLDSPQVPDNYDDAVKQLVALQDTIDDAFKANDPDAAHDPLHDVGHLLEGIEALITEGAYDVEHKEELLAAVNDLFDSYTAVDETFHGKEGKSYDEVSDKIAAAVQTLRDHVGHGKE